jgi:hypothetical protein
VPFFAQHYVMLPSAATENDIALEVNPLFARGEQIEALDALAVWKPG